ncbi:MAG: SGNH/GDSL hydrolase family protein [Pirellulales bacterium]
MNHSPFRLAALLAFLVSVASAASVASLPAVAQEPLPAESGTLEEESRTRWYPALALGLEGQGWRDVKSPYDRLPARAEGQVRAAVWGLSQQSAGLAVRFVTSSPTLQARWTVTSSNLAMPHMPATGVSGLDLYVRQPDGKWRWLANGRPAQQTTTATLVSGLPAEPREYLLYLPLYNGVKSLEIGVAEGTALAKAPPRPAERRGAIVFWGTSITQGGCASRPGMVHTSILGRRLDRDVINLGFSGNGKMEPEVARLVAELDAAVFVIDCLPNMDAAEVAERTEPLVKILREKQPRTPIVLVEDRDYADAYLVVGKRQRNESSRAALRAAFERLEKAGVVNLHYLPGAIQLGDDSEGTVDSSHPTDLGFVRMADAFEPLLKKVLPP